MTLIDKLQALKNRFASFRGTEYDLYQIDGWFEEAKRLMLLKSLKDQDGVKYVLEMLGGDVRKIDEALNKSYSKDLKDIERDRLLDKRDLANKLLQLFAVEEQLERLEEIVDSEAI